VATLDIQHLYAIPAPILNLLARFGTIFSAKSMQAIDSKLVEAGGVEVITALKTRNLLIHTIALSALFACFAR
jgi:hypothetical protein